MFIESVGINFRSSYFSGIDEKRLNAGLHVLRLLRGGSGPGRSSNIKTSDANNIGLTYELDAILRSSSADLDAGGRFSLLASIAGALVMQAITTSMYAIGVPAFALQAIKGVVVVLVILLYSEQVRGLLRRITAQKGLSKMQR